MTHISSSLSKTSQTEDIWVFNSVRTNTTQVIPKHIIYQIPSPETHLMPPPPGLVLQAAPMCPWSRQPSRGGCSRPLPLSLLWTTSSVTAPWTTSSPSAAPCSSATCPMGWRRCSRGTSCACFPWSWPSPWSTGWTPRPCSSAAGSASSGTRWVWSGHTGCRGAKHRRLESTSRRQKRPAHTNGIEQSK